MSSLARGPRFAAPALIALGFACGALLSQVLPQHPGQPAIEVFATPRPLAAFELRSAGGPFNRESLRGQWQLLVLGFSQCPDICPTTLQQLAHLQSQNQGRNLRVVFVSVDSRRDSPELLRDYVHFFGPDIIGVTGAHSELRQLAASLGMDFRLHGDGPGTVISHSPVIALIGPDGSLRGYLRDGFDTRQAVRELAALASPKA